MNERFFIAGYVALILATIIGISRFKCLDTAMRFLVAVLTVTAIVEITAFIAVKTGNFLFKNILYHIFNIAEAILISSFFLRSIKPNQKKTLMSINISIWVISGVLNIVLLQPFVTLNSNFLMLECFAIITMSLYFIYWLLIRKEVNNVFKYAHFWVAIIFIVLWSSTFFFWAFIAILYKSNWKYLDMTIASQAIINLLAYVAVALVLFFYPKMKKLENH